MTSDLITTIKKIGFHDDKIMQTSPLNATRLGHLGALEKYILILKSLFLVNKQSIKKQYILRRREDVNELLVPQ